MRLFSEQKVDNQRAEYLVGMQEKVTETLTVRGHQSGDSISLGDVTNFTQLRPQANVIHRPLLGSVGLQHVMNSVATGRP